MKIAVIFGGKSCEHDISIITGVMTVNAATRHQVIPIYINGRGEWLTGKNFNKTSTFLTPPKGKSVHLRPASNALYTDSGKILARLDAVIICTHGLNGEDGTLSGLLELSGIPYVGSGVLASAVGMDKIAQKRLFKSVGLPVLPFVGISKNGLPHDFFKKGTEALGKLGDGLYKNTLNNEINSIKNDLNNELNSINNDSKNEINSINNDLNNELNNINNDLNNEINNINNDLNNNDELNIINDDFYDKKDDFYAFIKKINNKLAFPLIVKPSSLGSSIGIGRAENYKELFARIDEAFMWDYHVIIENALTDFTELNCAVMGQGDNIITSEIEQPLSNNFLSFSDKYLDGQNGVKNTISGGMGGKSNTCLQEKRGKGGSSNRHLPAKIDKKTASLVKEYARAAFRAINGSGVSRIDFLLDHNKLYINEINTVPGSMANYLFTPIGIDFSTLIDRLLDVAIIINRQKNALSYTYNSRVLRDFSKIKK